MQVPILPQEETKTKQMKTPHLLFIQFPKLPLPENYFFSHFPDFKTIIPLLETPDSLNLLDEVLLKECLEENEKSNKKFFSEWYPLRISTEKLDLKTIKLPSDNNQSKKIILSKPEGTMYVDDLMILQSKTPKNTIYRKFFSRNFTSVEHVFFFFEQEQLMMWFKRDESTRVENSKEKVQLPKRFFFKQEDNLKNETTIKEWLQSPSFKSFPKIEKKAKDYFIEREDFCDKVVVETAFSLQKVKEHSISKQTYKYFTIFTGSGQGKTEASLQVPKILSEIKSLGKKELASKKSEFVEAQKILKDNVSNVFPFLLFVDTMGSYFRQLLQDLDFNFKNLAKLLLIFGGLGWELKEESVLVLLNTIPKSFFQKTSPDELIEAILDIKKEEDPNFKKEQNSNKRDLIFVVFDEFQTIANNLDKPREDMLLIKCLCETFRLAKKYFGVMILNGTYSAEVGVPFDQTFERGVELSPFLTRFHPFSVARILHEIFQEKKMCNGEFLQFLNFEAGKMEEKKLVSQLFTLLSLPRSFDILNPSFSLQQNIQTIIETLKKPKKPELIDKEFEEICEKIIFAPELIDVDSVMIDKYLKVGLLFQNQNEKFPLSISPIELLFVFEREKFYDTGKSFNSQSPNYLFGCATDTDLENFFMKYACTKIQKLEKFGNKKENYKLEDIFPKTKNLSTLLDEKYDSASVVLKEDKISFHKQINYELEKRVSFLDAGKEENSETGIKQTVDQLENQMTNSFNLFEEDMSHLDTIISFTYKKQDQIIHCLMQIKSGRESVQLSPFEFFFKQIKKKDPFYLKMEKAYHDTAEKIDYIVVWMNPTIKVNVQQEMIAFKQEIQKSPIEQQQNIILALKKCWILDCECFSDFPINIKEFMLVGLNEKQPPPTNKHCIFLSIKGQQYFEWSTGEIREYKDGIYEVFSEGRRAFLTRKYVVETKKKLSQTNIYPALFEYLANEKDEFFEKLPDNFVMFKNKTPVSSIVGKPIAYLDKESGEWKKGEIKKYRVQSCIGCLDVSFDGESWTQFHPLDNSMENGFVYLEHMPHKQKEQLMFLPDKNSIQFVSGKAQSYEIFVGRDIIRDEKVYSQVQDRDQFETPQTKAPSKSD